MLDRELHTCVRAYAHARAMSAMFDINLREEARGVRATCTRAVITRITAFDGCDSETPREGRGRLRGLSRDATL